MTTKKLEGGGYEIRGDYEDPRTGKRRQVRRRFKTLREAREFERELLTGEATGKRGMPTFEAYAKEWLETRTRLKKLTPSTYRTYAWVISTASKTLGQRKLNTITPAHVEAAMLDISEHLSTGSAKLMQASIKQIMRYAERDGFCSSNPVNALEPVTHKSKRISTPEVEDIRSILQAAEACPYAYVYLLTLASTGCRKGELYGLLWDSVDLDRGVIRIQRQRNAAALSSQAAYPGDFGERVPGLDAMWRLRDSTKTRQNRDVKIPSNVAELLRATRNRQLENRLRMGEDYIVSDYVFTRDDGRPLVDADVRPYTQGYTLHSFRHAHATILLEEGVPLISVSRRLGHSILATTSDIYADLLRKQDDAASDVFSAALDTKMTHEAHTSTNR